MLSGDVEWNSKVEKRLALAITLNIPKLVKKLLLDFRPVCCLVWNDIHYPLGRLTILSQMQSRLLMLSLPARNTLIFWWFYLRCSFSLTIYIIRLHSLIDSMIRLSSWITWEERRLNYRIGRRCNINRVWVIDYFEVVIFDYFIDEGEPTAKRRRSYDLLYFHYWKWIIIRLFQSFEVHPTRGSLFRCRSR